MIKRAQEAGKNYIDAAEYERNELDQLTNTLDEIIENVTGGNEETTPDVPTINESVLALKAGDYVKYDSGKNGVITCRVLYPVSSEYGLQIISDKSVKNITLGSANYSASVVSYNNAIVTLNNEAENYLNTEYAYDARCVGSAPTIENGMFVDKDKVKFEGTTQYVVPSSANYYKLPFNNPHYVNSFSTDINYETDFNAMKAATSQSAGIHATGKAYWLASRILYCDSAGCGFVIRLVGSTGGLVPYNVFYLDSKTNAAAYSYEYGLRPCISLKSDSIKITSGDGKSDDTAYVIGK